MPGCAVGVVPLLSDVQGSEVVSTWHAWPHGSAFVGWNESCAGRNVPTYIDCSTVVIQPPSLMRHTAVVAEDTNGDAVVYVFGGREGEPNNPPRPELSSTLYAYHVHLSLWWMPFNGSDVLSGQHPRARQSHVSFVAEPGAVVVVHGGFSDVGAPLADMWRYGGNGSWEEVGGVGGPHLAGHSVVVRGGRAYLFGGYTPGGLANDLWEYNIANASFIPISTSGPQPKPRAHHTAVLLSDWQSPAYSIRDGVSPGVFPTAWETLQKERARYMVIQGGVTLTAGQEVATQDFWRLDLDTFVWEEVTPQAGGYRKQVTGTIAAAIPLQARQSHTCVGVLQRMLCYGGWDASGAHYLDAFEYDMVLNRVLPLPFDNKLPAKLFASTAVFLPRNENQYTAASYSVITLGGVVSGSLPASPAYTAEYSPTLCKAGLHSPDGDWMCFPCPSGHKSSPYSCEACPPGHHVAADGRSCAQCPAGTYAEVNGTASVSGCLPCPSGTQSAAGSTSFLDCGSCPLGTYSNTSGTTCSECPAGTKGVLVGGSAKWQACEVCPYGTYSAAASGSCSACPAGTQSAPMVQRIWPYTLAIGGWGTSSCATSCLTACEGERSSTAKRYLCGSCGPSPTSTYSVKAGVVLYVMIRVYDVGGIGTSSTAPTGMARLQSYTTYMTEAVTVEKVGGAGALSYSCGTAYPASCATVGNEEVSPVSGATYSATAASHPCRTTSGANEFHFTLRLDATTPQTTLTFRAAAMMPATLTLAVTGSDISVLQGPPAYVVATDTFTMRLALADAFGTVDTESSGAVTLASPLCYAVIDGTVDTTLLSTVHITVNGAGGSATTQSSVVSFASGVISFTVAVSGATFANGISGVAARVQCTLRFSLASDTAVTVDTATFFVQQPHHIYVSHTGRTHAGHPIRVHAEVRDANDDVLNGDSSTVLRLEALRTANVVDVNDTQLAAAFKDTNASLLAMPGSSLVTTVSAGQADFFVTMDYPASVGLKVSALSSHQSIAVLYNDSVALFAGHTLATRLALMDTSLDPLLEPFPYVVMGNSTLRIGVKACDSGGHVDFTANYLIGVNLTGCTSPETYVRQVNTSLGAQSDALPDVSDMYFNSERPVFRLHAGLGVAELWLDGHDTDECKLTFFHILTPDNPQDLKSGNRSVLPFQAPPISIRNPASLDVEWDVPHCNSTTCVWCNVGVGKEVKVRVHLRSQSGTAVTWVNPSGAAHIRRVSVAMSLATAGAFPDNAVALRGSIGTSGEHGVTSHVHPDTGAADFYFTPNTASNGTFTLTFAVGEALSLDVLNVTYAQDGFSFKKIVSSLGATFTVQPWGFVDSVATCAMTAVAVATRLVVLNDPVVWLASGEVLSLFVEAQDDHGNRVHDITGPVKATVRNCAAGYHTSLAFYLAENATEVRPLSSAAARTYMGSGATTFPLYGVLPAVHYEHDVAYKTLKGASDCSVLLEMDPPPSGYLRLQGTYGPFELFRLAGVCDPCPLGSWSAGGEGDFNNEWSGGCKPCPVGTYSAKPQASSESECLVCPAGYGYDTSSTWTYDTTLGYYKAYHEGRSRCAACPSGSTSAGNPTGGSCASLSSNTPTYALGGGQTGLTCSSGACAGCAAGHYYMSCSSYSTQTTCEATETQGLCSWTSSCFFADAAKRPSVCLPCPAGTVQTSGNNYNGYSSCTACALGVYSSNTGHPTSTSRRRQSTSGTYEIICSGSGTGLCPDGTYGTTTGAANVSFCADCPSGTWSASVLMYGVTESVGASFCFQCPPGTYSTEVRATSSDACVTCPPGHYCPAGCTDPLPADRDATIMHLGVSNRVAGGALTAAQSALLATNTDVTLGHIPTVSYSMEGFDEPVYCDALSGVAATHDSSGWVKDGHFSFSTWEGTYPNVFGASSTVTDHWAGVVAGTVPGASISTSYDHTQPATALSAVCSAAGGDTSGSYHNATNGWYFCCPSSCGTGNGGLGCGVQAACDVLSSLKSTCCPDDILASFVTCGVSGSAPCLLSGPTGSSGSLRLNATHDRFIQKRTLGITNTLPLHARVWGYSVLQVDTDVRNFTFGMKVHFYDSAEQMSASNASHTETVIVEEPFLSIGNTWRLGEAVFTVPEVSGELSTLYGFGIEPFTEGGYLGAVYLDDVSLRVDPAFACNCSLGYFYNRSRTAISTFSSACQRCPRGSMCVGGTLQRCADDDVTQGGSFQCGGCPEGWLCDYDGRGSSSPCLFGTYEDPSPGVDMCRTCPLGASCRDGRLSQCADGTYGNGGRHCGLCLPGFFSAGTNERNVLNYVPSRPATTDATGNFTQELHFLPGDSSANVRCTKCPPGYDSNYMRKTCTHCRVNTFSADGDECTTCPPHTFTRDIGSHQCESCFDTAAFPDVRTALSRNSAGASVTLLPLACIDATIRWAVLSYKRTNETTQLGTLRHREPPEKGTFAVTFTPTTTDVGDAEYEFIVQRTGVRSAGVIQLVRATFALENSAPVARSDTVVVAHSSSTQVVALEGLLLNDDDADGDALFIASDVSFSGGTTGAHRLTAASLTIDSTRTVLYVTLPPGFTGPMSTLTYRAQDKDVTLEECTAANGCRFSETAGVTITAKDAPPVARDDVFGVVSETPTLLDVLGNDVDADGDSMSVCERPANSYVLFFLSQIIAVSDASTFGGSVNTPLITTLCTKSGATCTMSVTSLPGYVDLVCTYSVDMDACSANGTRAADGAHVALSPMWVSYASLPSFCGSDAFTYTVQANEASTSTASVTVNALQCLCTGEFTPYGFDALFLLDSSAGTGTAFPAFVAAVCIPHHHHPPTHHLHIPPQTKSMLQRFDFTVHSGRVRIGGYHFGAVGWDVVSTLQSASFASALDVASAQGYATVACGAATGCVSLGPALQEAYTVLTAGTGQKALTLFLAHPVADTPATLHHWGTTYAAANITLGIIATDAASDQAAALSFLQPSLLKVYAAASQLLADADLSANHISDICKDM